MKKATIFGGGQNKITPDYEFTVEIGKLLALNDFTVYNGGYRGLMEAASKGTTEKGGIAVGVTCKTFYSTKGNEYLTENYQAIDIFERLRILMQSDVFIIQKGGIGTMAELFLSWDILRKSKEEFPVIIILHDYVEEMINIMKESNLVSEKELSKIFRCNTIKDIEIILKKIVKN